MITVAITRGIDPSTRGCAHCTITVSTVHCSYSETAKCSQVQPNRAFNGIRPRPAAPAGARSVSSPPRLRTAATTKPRRSMSSPATGRTAVARSARPAGDRPHHRRRPGHSSAQQEAGSVSLLQKPQSPRLSWARCAAVRRARGPPSSSERRDPGVVLSRGDRREDSRHARRPPLPPPRHRCPTLCAVIIFSVL